MRLVDPLDVSGAGAGAHSDKRSDNDFVVEVSPESLEFLRSFGELGLNVVSVFGGTPVNEFCAGVAGLGLSGDAHTVSRTPCLVRCWLRLTVTLRALWRMPTPGAGTGKSTLMNCLTGVPNMFEVRDSVPRSSAQRCCAV